MKRLLTGFLISLFLTSQCFAAYEWRKGTGENVMLGTENASDIDILSYYYMVNPLDRLLSVYRRGAQITYASASSLTVGIGEATCQNSDGTIRKMRANTSATTVGWSDIDTGSEVTSTTYYVYAVADADANTFTVTISTNSTTPTGKTYYRRLGSFYNDASGNITNISNDESPKYATYDSGWFAVGTSSSYTKTHGLGTTKLLIELYFATDSNGTAMTRVPAYVESGVADCGAIIYNISTTALTIGTTAFYVSGGSSHWNGYTGNQSSGYYRVIAIALE